MASQSGYGEDPVFVIDTLRDIVLQVETIDKMAVGVATAVSPRHRKLFVARGNFPCRDLDSGYTGSPLYIVDLHSNREVRTLRLQTSVNLVVLSPDEDYALVANGEQISIIDTSLDSILRT